MSSRNAYLDPQQRKSALVLSRALKEVERGFAGGRNAEQLISTGKAAFTSEPGARLDYLEIVDPNTLDPIATITAPVLVAVAAFVGTTRLIDNVILSVTSRS
jgi:pantoate--beta-alanine ligase